MKWNECNLIVFGFILGGITASTFEVALHFNSILFLGPDGRLQWETLVTGIGAVVAAFFTVRHLREQITQTGNSPTISDNGVREQHAPHFRSHFPN